jgi:hypothetical protein
MLCVFRSAALALVFFVMFLFSSEGMAGSGVTALDEAEALSSDRAAVASSKRRLVKLESDLRALRFSDDVGAKRSVAAELAKERRRRIEALARVERDFDALMPDGLFDGDACASFPSAGGGER